jgi:hypothetical protein
MTIYAEKCSPSPLAVSPPLTLIPCESYLMGSFEKTNAEK